MLVVDADFIEAIVAGFTEMTGAGLTVDREDGFTWATGEDLPCDEDIFDLLDIIPDGDVAVLGKVVFGIDVVGITKRSKNYIIKL